MYVEPIARNIMGEESAGKESERKRKSGDKSTPNAASMCKHQNHTQRRFVSHTNAHTIHDAQRLNSTLSKPPKIFRFKFQKEHQQKNKQRTQIMRVERTAKRDILSLCLGIGKSLSLPESELLMHNRLKSFVVKCTLSCTNAVLKS